MNSLEDVRPGDTLGRYELLAPVAQGGMAAVWAARLRGSRGFQRVVAIKTILPNLIDDPAFEEMFLDEASLASRIQHPHVAQILDLGEENDVLYLVMEWVDGESLSILSRAANKLTGKPIPIPIAARIVMQAAAGLHAAHELRDEEGNLLDLVHRDVSPQNILLTYDGAVKVVDFGVAKAIGRTSSETTAGQLKGKVPYMSPEQALGGHVDRRTDIFALGTIFYQLVTGKHPFRGENDVETLNNILSRPVLRPRASDPSFPQEIEEVLMTALAKEANDRYPTMAAFEAALGAAVAKLGIVTSDSQVSEFVMGLLEPRAKKRRDALKDAMKAADEQSAGWREAPLTISPSHSGLTATGAFPRGEATSPHGRKPTPPSLTAVASDGPASFADIATAISTPSAKRKRVAAMAGALGFVVVGGLAAFAMTRGEAPDTSPSETATGAASLPAKVEVAEAKPEEAAVRAPEAEAGVLGEEAEPAEPIEEADFGETALSENERGAAKAPKAAAPRVQAPSEAPKAPATPKRRRVPEVQDPGF